MTNNEQRQSLSDELSRLDGTKMDGQASIVCLPFSTPTRYLSGVPYLFTQFVERAYVMDQATAEHLIESYPAVLQGATILRAI